VATIWLGKGTNCGPWKCRIESGNAGVNASLGSAEFYYLFVLKNGMEFIMEIFINQLVHIASAQFANQTLVSSLTPSSFLYLIFSFLALWAIALPL
jgi:hypothetical protein